MAAKSKGSKLDEITLNTIFQLAGARQGWLDWESRITNEFELTETLLSYVLNTVVQEAMNTTHGSGILQIAPETFGPVDVSEEQGTERVLSAGTSVTLLTHTDYAPRAVGISQLRVSTHPRQFGGQQISRTEPIEVGRITLRFARGAETLNDLRVAANRTYTVQLRVEERSHPEDVSFDPLPAGTGSLTAVSLGGGVTEVRYTTSNSLEHLPFSLTARHTARTGAREFSTEPRVANLSVLPLDLRITPNVGCIEPGQPRTFTAELDGEVQREVQWTASVGSISSSGVYTPPTGAAQGTAVVIGAKVTNADGEFEDAIDVYVGRNSRTAARVSRASHGVRRHLRGYARYRRLHAAHGDPHGLSDAGSASDRWGR